MYENTVVCRCNVVEQIMILHTEMQWKEQNINQILNSQMAPHSSPSQASYGVSIVRILEEIDCVMMAPHCMLSVM